MKNEINSHSFFDIIEENSITQRSFKLSNPKHLLDINSDEIIYDGDLFMEMPGIYKKEKIYCVLTVNNFFVCEISTLLPKLLFELNNPRLKLLSSLGFSLI